PRGVHCRRMPHSFEHPRVRHFVSVRKALREVQIARSRLFSRHAGLLLKTQMRATKPTGKTIIARFKLRCVHFHTAWQMASDGARQRRKRPGDKHDSVAALEMPAHMIYSIDEQSERSRRNCFLPLSDNRFVNSCEIIFAGGHRAAPTSQKSLGRLCGPSGHVRSPDFVTRHQIADEPPLKR